MQQSVMRQSRGYADFLFTEYYGLSGLLVKTAGNQNLPALLDTRGASVKNPVPGKRAVMTALSIGGMILLPIRKKQEKDKEAEESRRRRIAAAKRGDEQAMESLTLEDIDTYTEISHRIIHEDVFSIVDSTFIRAVSNVTSIL